MQPGIYINIYVYMYTLRGVNIQYTSDRVVPIDADDDDDLI
jgi:hypothetical protein